MPDLQDRTDEQLAADASQPGSQMAHWIEFEFRRRELQIARETSLAQISAARWTMGSAIAVAVSVVVAAVGIWVDALVLGSQ
ncbi:hypothetical protein [Ruegeria atlantica]|uniref:hypothetical protein n=1 Tax=Ruegeria atlantica TaxID=81569 RepID=UPI00147D4587|nr:hypothetical protein [Ruegeria atlantica]